MTAQQAKAEAHDASRDGDAGRNNRRGLCLPNGQAPPATGVPALAFGSGTYEHLGSSLAQGRPGCPLSGKDPPKHVVCGLAQPRWANFGGHAPQLGQHVVATHARGHRLVAGGLGPRLRTAPAMGEATGLHVRALRFPGGAAAGIPGDGCPWPALRTGCPLLPGRPRGRRPAEDLAAHPRRGRGLGGDQRRLPDDGGAPTCPRCRAGTGACGPGDRRPQDARTPCWSPWERCRGSRCSWRSTWG